MDAKINVSKDIYQGVMARIMKLLESITKA